MVSEAKINCPHCYQIIILEQDEKNQVFIIDENDSEKNGYE